MARSMSGYAPLPDRTPQGDPGDDSRLDGTMPRRIDSAATYFDQYEQTPTTQNGIAPEQPRHAQELYLDGIGVDGIDLATRPDAAPDGNPNDGGGAVYDPVNGSGSLGPQVEGWHPGSGQ